MILLDFSQVCISAVLVHKDAQFFINQDYIRHTILNMIRSYKQKYSKEYGNEIILAVDSGNSWRKDISQYYKAHRQDTRDKNQKEETVDWTKLYSIMEKIENEIKEFFPYKVIRYDRTEADDIISIIAKIGEQRKEKVLILSKDSDFCQLHSEYIKQYDMISKKWVVIPDVKEHLYTKIITGERGDGIPNVFSGKNFLYDKIRQNSSKKNMIDAIMPYMENWTIDNASGISDDVKIRLNENREMICFTRIPDYIINGVTNLYNEYKEKDRSQIYNYLVKNKLKDLLGKVREF